MPVSNSIVVRCLTCGSKFKVWPSYIKRGDGRYCSKRCFLVGMRRSYRYNYDTQFITKPGELSAYFWGLFVSDGAHSRKGDVLIGLTDKQLIMDLAKRVRFTGKVGYQRRKPPRSNLYSLRFSGAVPAELFRNGYERGPKTGREFIPKCIGECNLRHFVRGLWDGDGCITLRTDTRNCLLRSNLCCANRELLNDVHLRLLKLHVVDGGSIYPHRGIFYLRFSHNDSLDLCKWMYNKSTIRLERKYQKYLVGVTTGRSVEQKDLVCSVAGCAHPCLSKGLCEGHYQSMNSRRYYVKNKDKIRDQRIRNKDRINYLARLRHASKKRLAA